MDIKVNKPAPIALGTEVELFKRGVNVKQTIIALEAGKTFLIKDFYNNGLTLLDEIQKYLDLGISKASIAKLINCHAQTLYNYVEKRGLEAQRDTVGAKKNQTA